MDVSPSLTYTDLEAALAFLEQAFGFVREDVGSDSQGMVRYASLRYGRGLVLVQPDLPGELHGTHIGQGWVYVAVSNLDAHFEHARAAGAAILGEPHDAFEGRLRGYSARDPEGNLWSFGENPPGYSPRITTT